MCGIIGGVKDKFQNYPKYFETLKHRGVDSFGLVGFSNNKVDWYKVMSITTNTKKFLKPIEGYDYWLGHNRWASIGGVNIDLAHPIEIDNILVIHNGTKKPIKEIFSKGVESDTQGISILIKDSFENLEFLSNILQDTGVVFGINQTNGKILFHRDETRPLMINKDRTLIASEPIERGEWALIKKQDKLFNSFEEFLNSVEVYDWVKVEENNLYHPIKCDKCGKKHYLKGVHYCFACNSKYKLSNMSQDWDENPQTDWFINQMVCINPKKVIYDFDIGYITNITNNRISYFSLLYNQEFTERIEIFKNDYTSLKVKHIKNNSKVRFKPTLLECIYEGVIIDKKLYFTHYHRIHQIKTIQGIVYTKNIYENLDWDSIF